MAAKNVHASLEQRLRSDQRVFLLDGGTGEELFRRGGVPDDRTLWSATAVVHAQHHAALQEVHRSFLQAGAHAVTTNSYGVTPGVGLATNAVIEHCATAGRLAREVVDAANGDCDQGDDSDASYYHCYVLGSLGPLVESYRPDLIRQHDEGVAIYADMISALSPYVDAFLAETLSSVEESMQPVEALALCNDRSSGSGSGSGTKKQSLLISYTLQSDGNLRSGETVSLAIPRILNFAKEKNVQGTMTTGGVFLKESDVILFAN